MKEYSVMSHKSSSEKKLRDSKVDIVRNCIYSDIMASKANVEIPLSKQLERFKKSVKK